MICFLLLVSMAASCLGGRHHQQEVPEYWHPASPQLRPIMKEVKQTLAKQASDVSICGVLKSVFTMVINARQALDCGAAAAVSSTDLPANTDHQAIVEATRSCIGPEDLCLINKLGSLKAKSSPSLVCSALRDLESALQIVLDLVNCHEELELGSTELGGITCWGCASIILANAKACYSHPNVVQCIRDALGATSGCLDCICTFIPC